MNALSESVETDLVRRAGAGDQNAFSVIYQRYRRVVHGILLNRVPPADAEDLLHDVFLSALAKLPGLRDPSAFPAWIGSIARNAAADYHRERRRWSLPTLRGFREPSVKPEALLVLDEIKALPEAYRETLILRLVEGLNGPEIAERTGLAPDSVRVNLHRGMKLLRNRLGNSR